MVASKISPLFRTLIARRDLTIAVIVLLFALQAAIRSNSYLNPDIAWYIYAGGRLLDGARYYVDVVDLMPPFVIWASMPIAAIGRVTGVNVEIIFHTVLLTLTAVSICLSARLIAAATDITAGARHLFLVLLAALVLFLPASDFGQRDHVVIVLASPWVFLRWSRLIDRPVPWGLAAVIGLMAAVGLWLNSYFLFVVIALEIAVLLVARNARIALRIETLAIVGLGLTYMLALWFASFKSSVKISLVGMRVLDPTDQVGLEDFELRLALVAVLLAITIATSRLLSAKSRLLQTVLVVVGTAFMFVFLVQPGFRYQLIPAHFFLTLAAGLGLARLGAGEVTIFGPLERTAAAAAALAILVVFAGTLSVQTVPYQGRSLERAIIAEAPKARSFFIASVDISHSFPLVEETGLIWASRYSSQWLAPYVANNLDEDGGPADDIGRTVIKSTYDDLKAFAPEIVFVNENPVRPRFTGPPLDHVKLWETDERLKFFWRNKYRRRGVVDGFGVYVLKE